ncbi:putative ATP-dependent RNA helicase [Blastocystis sp. subtype 4]|uniref:putative ATP-dependent RNA helicase n=1 Tax=Blastocystis sp. subtype 4 TaxID=944170 RepID=UPI0007119F6A|nr:putative ATP-dependent RNA helicase [Blastocystis sp. subtype 4]KNB41985.1 putative ATP-dependent RNA helicase [Blastocystis sp. subtype 4]|eukprot:XP_014525428.1 putative ATP-dependent RNA helicase [Blastocystis sp. subtype 4]
MYCLHTSRLEMESDELKPRRLAATTVAKRVAEEKRVVLGEEVGYSIQFDYMFNRNGKISQIKYLTNKELLREMMRNPLLAQYSVVIVDEAHERSVDNDVLLGLLKKIIQKRQDLRLVISSASVEMNR